MGEQATGFDLYVRDLSSDQVTLYSVSLDGTLEATTPLSGAALDAAEVRIGRDLSGNGVAGASITGQLLDRWNSFQGMGNHADLLRNLYVSNQGLVVSRDGIQYPGDLRTAPIGQDAWQGPYVLLLRNASGNASFQIPDGFSAVAVTADRNIDSDGPEAVESFTLYLTSDDSSEVRSQQFNLDGIAEQQPTTLSGVELANAELRLGVDLDDNEIIGAPDAIQLFDRYGTGNNTQGNSPKRYLISTDQGLVVSRDGLGMDASGSSGALADLRNIAGRYENRYDGPGAVLLSDSNGDAFSLQQGQTVQGVVLTRSTVFNGGMSAAQAGMGSIQEVFSGFELYVNDGTTSTLLSFDSKGQFDSSQTLSEDERFAREISAGFDLNGDGITGISLTREVAHGRPLDSQSSYSMGRSRFAYEGDEGIVLTRNRLYPSADASGDTANGSSYDLGSQNANSDLWSGPAAVLLSDASGNALQGIDLRAARSTYSATTNSNQEIADGFEVVISGANGFELLSFDLNGRQMSSEALSATDLSNAEIWSRTDLDGNGIIGAEINSLLASGRTNDSNPGSGQWRDGIRRFAYNTSEGVLLSVRSFNTTANNDPMMQGSMMDLRQAGDYYENRYEGPQQILLSNGNNSAYSIPAGYTVLAACEQICRYENSAESYADGFELILNNANTGTISAVSFDLDGQLIADSALSVDEVSALEVELIADLNGDGITGAQVVEQLYNKDNNNFNLNNYSATSMSPPTTISQP